MNDQENHLGELKKKLDGHYQWPAAYPFKFIVKQEQVPEVQALFPGELFSTKPSANGKYMGMTLEKVMNSSADVLAVYERVKVVQGLMAL
jgi:putative lipoic acid-binding regulatory protein